MSSHYSPASAGSTSASSAAATASSARSRSIPSAEPSSKSTGPDSGATTTSQHSTLPMFPDPSMSLPADSPARTLAQPVRVPGSEEHAPVCGSTWRGLSASYARRGASLRTSLLCVLEALTWFSLTWKNSGTTYGRSWWVLGRSARRTGEIASGSSRIWHSPCAGDSKNVPYRRDHGTKGRERAALLGQAQGRTWPTPVTEDSEQTGSTRRHPTLTGEARKDWPTVTARDCESPAKVTRGAGAMPGGTPLVLAVQNWPTPHGLDNEDNPRRNGPTGNELGRAVTQNWPTPRESEHKGTGPKGSKSQKYRLAKGYLGATVEEVDGRPDLASHSTIGKRRGSLNSAWVAQLQGYPSDWCALPTETLSRLTATRSSPKSSRRS